MTFLEKSVIMYIRDKIKLYSRFNVEGALKMLKKATSYHTVRPECAKSRASANRPSRVRKSAT